MNRSNQSDQFTRTRVLVILLPLLTFAGCMGSGDGLVPVTGTVSFDGAPIPEGRIQFRMTEGDRKAYAAQIVDGTYAARVEPGPASVEVRASRLIPGKMDESNPDDPQPVGEMYIPEKYNSRTELTAQIEGATDSEDFALTGS